MFLCLSDCQFNSAWLIMHQITLEVISRHSLRFKALEKYIQNNVSPTRGERRHENYIRVDRSSVCCIVSCKKIILSTRGTADTLFCNIVHLTVILLLHAEVLKTGHLTRKQREMPNLAFDPCRARYDSHSKVYWRKLENNFLGRNSHMSEALSAISSCKFPSDMASCWRRVRIHYPCTVDVCFSCIKSCDSTRNLWVRRRCIGAINKSIQSAYCRRFWRLLAPISFYLLD